MENVGVTIENILVYSRYVLYVLYWVLKSIHISANLWLKKTLEMHQNFNYVALNTQLDAEDGVKILTSLSL